MLLTFFLLFCSIIFDLYSLFSCLFFLFPRFVIYIYKYCVLYVLFVWTIPDSTKMQCYTIKHCTSCVERMLEVKLLDKHIIDAPFLGLIRASDPKQRKKGKNSTTRQIMRRPSIITSTPNESWFCTITRRIPTEPPSASWPRWRSLPVWEQKAPMPSSFFHRHTTPSSTSAWWGCRARAKKLSPKVRAITRPNIRPYVPKARRYTR